MLNIPTSLEDSISQLARKAGKPVDAFLSGLIAEYQSEQEAITRAREVLAGIDAGTIKTVSLDEVLKEYEMED